MVKDLMIDVVIMFDGDPLAFQITPTQRILGTTAQLEGQYLVISVRDDDCLQAELDRRLGDIQGNLRSEDERGTGAACTLIKPSTFALSLSRRYPHR